MAEQGERMLLQFLTSLEGSRFSLWLVQSDTIWAYPTVLTLHTVGLALLVGANTALDLRLLGFGRKLPLETLTVAFPVMWAGFWINAVSGAMLFAADATTKGSTTIFQLKLGLIVLGIINIWLLKRAAFGSNLPTVTIPAKVLAGTSLLIWMIAITLGRFMAYI
jgi:hypothetical protein